MEARSSTPPGEGIRRLADRYALPGDAPPRLAMFVARLISDPYAPTALRDERLVLNDHIADSLIALDLPEVRAARTLADIGSGAGLPGVVIAIARPELSVALVESSARKASFLAEVIDDCGIPNASAVHARVEAWPQGCGAFDVVTARAIAPLDVVAEYAAPLLRVGGVLVAWRGRRDESAEAAAAVAARCLAMEVSQPIQVRPYPGAEHRHLHVMTKRASTPARFPRRPGMARKRPLGGLTRQTAAVRDDEPTSDRNRR